jgi:hypothetical protein
MDARRSWRRLDAEHWVHVSGMALTTLLVIGTAWALLGGVLVGAAVLAVLPAGLAALAGWLTSAWRQERPWAWWAWTIGSAAGTVTALDAVVAGRTAALAPLLAGGVLLLLLFHPDCRARIEARSPLPR